MDLTPQLELDQLCRCKNHDCPFTEVPRHGSVAWRPDGTDGWLEFQFWDKPPNQTGWIPATEFSRLKREIKQNNVEFFRTHPEDLRRKIDLKRRAAGLFRSSGSLRHYEWAY